jgi:hypothetical protein
MVYGENSAATADQQKHFLKFKLYLDELIEPRDHLSVTGSFYLEWAEPKVQPGEGDMLSKYLPSSTLFKRLGSYGFSAEEDNTNSKIAFSSNDESDQPNRGPLHRILTEKMPAESLALACPHWDTQTLRLPLEKPRGLAARKDSVASHSSNDGRFQKMRSKLEATDSSIICDDNASCDSPTASERFGKDEILNINRFLNLQKTIKVKVFFPAQFEAVRSMEKIYLADYIDSLAQIKPWAENTGGKRES